MCIRDRCQSSPAFYPDATAVHWVLMANTVPMHYNDYEHLLQIYRPVKGAASVFPKNNGSSYAAKPLGGRPVYHNDGTYVQGNMERDRFVVRCSKKEQAGSALQFEPSSGLDDVAGGTGGAGGAEGAEAAAQRTSTFLFYTPPSSFMSTVMLCFIMTALLFMMFYNLDAVHSTTFMVFLGIVNFVMFAMSLSLIHI